MSEDEVAFADADAHTDCPALADCLSGDALTPPVGRNEADRLAFSACRRRDARAKRAWLVRDAYLAAPPQGAAVSRIEREKKTQPIVSIWKGGRRGKVKTFMRPPKDPAMASAFEDGAEGGEGAESAAPGIVGGKRGRIKGGMSRASRRRIFERLAEVARNAAMPLFVTLTLARELHASARQAKGWLRALEKRWRRTWGAVCALWKMEPQKDGTPHFHLLVWGVPRLAWQRVAVEWAEVVTGKTLGKDYPIAPGSVGAEMFRDWLAVAAGGCELLRKQADAGTSVEAIKTWRGVMSYVAKYIGKETAPMEDSGRFWGVWGRKAMPWAERVEVVVKHFVAFRVIAHFRRELRARKGWEPWIESAKGILCENPDKFLRWLERGAR